MAAAAIFYFLNFKFSTGRTAEEVELCHRAKFRRNRSNRCRDDDFSIFPKWRSPPSWICYARIQTNHEGHLVVFITVQNLVGIDAVVLIICMFFDFANLA